MDKRKAVKVSHHCSFCAPYHWLWGSTEPPAEGQILLCARVFSSLSAEEQQKVLRSSVSIEALKMDLNGPL